jgi:hypothetical protein
MSLSMPAIAAVDGSVLTSMMTSATATGRLSTSVAAYAA